MQHFLPLLGEPLRRKQHTRPGVLDDIPQFSNGEGGRQWDGNSIASQDRKQGYYMISRLSMIQEPSSPVCKQVKGIPT